MKTPEEMDNHELSRAVCVEVCGWDVRYFRSRAGWKMRRPGSTHWENFYRFASSLDDCRIAEEIIEQRLGVSYYAWLDALSLRPEWDKHNSLQWGYVIFRATPRVRCQAMLRAVRESARKATA